MWIYQLRSTDFATQLKEGVAHGSLRDVEIENLLPLIKYSIEFISLGKSLHKKLYDMDEKGFALYAEKQKEHIKSMICKYLIIGEGRLANEPDCSPNP